MSFLTLIPTSCLLATSAGFSSQKTFVDLKKSHDKQITEAKYIPDDKYQIDKDGVLSGFTAGTTFEVLAKYNTLRIPSSVKEIKANAFSNMFDQYSTILKLDLTQATDLEIIGDAAFLNCYAFGAPARSTIDFSHCTKLKYIGIDAFSGCEVLGDDNGELDLSVCTQLTKIGSSAFRYGHFETLKLPQSLEEGDVGALAFSNCTQLKTIDFSKLITIPTWMYNSRDLFVNIVEKGSTLTERAICINCSKFTSNDWKEVFIRQDVPFNDGSSTTNFDIKIESKLDLADSNYFDLGPETEQGLTITGIKAAGIAELEKATTLYISKNIYRFDNKVNFQGMITPNDNRKTVSLVFESPETSKFQYFSDGSETNDPKGCFMGCTALSGKIVFPKNLKTMPKNAFNGCTGITELDFSNVLLTGQGQEYSFVFDTSCFEDCSKLRKVIFPPLMGELYFQKKVFRNDIHLSIIDFSSSADCSPLQRGDQLSGSEEPKANEWPFYNICTRGHVVASNDTTGFLDQLVNRFELKAGDREPSPSKDYKYWKYSIPGGETSWKLEDYATTGNYTLFGFKKNKLASINTINCVKIPDSILTISDNSFDNILFAKDGDNWFKWSLKLNNGLQTIGNRAFGNGCHLIGNLDIPNTVTSIGNEAFYKCSSLTGELNLPSHIKTVGAKAFAGCKNMWNTKLLIPSSVNEIGSFAFAEMPLIEGIEFEANDEIKLAACVFGEMSGLKTLDLSALSDEQFTTLISKADEAAFNTNVSVGTHKVIVPSGKKEEWKKSLESKGLDTTSQWTVEEKK